MAETRPQPADLLIMKPSHSAALFMVGSDEDHPQLSCGTYQEALHYATTSARRLKVDVWSTTNGGKFELVAAYRDGTKPSA